MPADLPGSSPEKPFHLPYPSLGERLTGREKELRQLRALFLPDGPENAPSAEAPAVVVAITDTEANANAGAERLAGSGKTRLAVEYAWRHAADYRAVLFVRANNQAWLETGLAWLAGAEVLNVMQQVDGSEEARLAATLAWLAIHPGWLLILDNLASEAAAQAAEKVAAKLRGGHVLLTALHPEWIAGASQLELGPLATFDATQYLLKSTDERRRKQFRDGMEAIDLAAELSHTPLALELAAAAIAFKQLSLAGYRALRGSPALLEQARHRTWPASCPSSLAATWLATLERLDPAELALLRILSWLAPELIPMTMLESREAERVWRVAEKLPRPEVPSFNKFALLHRMEETVWPARPRDCLFALARLALVHRDAGGKNFVLPPFVRDILRADLPPGEGQVWLRFALEWLDLALPEENDEAEPATQKFWIPLQAHVAAAVAKADEMGLAGPTARLMRRLGAALHQQGLVEEAEPLLRRALALTEALAEPPKGELAACLNRLALLLKDTERAAEGVPLMRRALEANENSLLCLNMSLVLTAAYQHGEAEDLLRETLAADEALWGPEHVDVARDLGYLGDFLQNAGRSTESEPVLRRASVLFEKNHGAGHLDVVLSLFRLGEALQDLGRLDEARQTLERVVALSEVNFGPAHPRVAQALSKLARVHREARRYGEAEALLRRALAIDEAALGVGHPAMAGDLAALAKLLTKDLGRIAEALPLLQRALEIAEASVGLDHGVVANILGQMAEVLIRIKRGAEAEALLRRALAIDEEKRGPEHRNVAHHLSNLAHHLRDAGREAEAEPLMRRALAILEMHVGSDHPDVATCLNNLALLLSAGGQRKEAEPLHRRALDIWEKVLGPEDPQLATGLSNFACLLQHNGERAEAVARSQRAVRILLAIGRRARSEHQHLKHCLNNHAEILKAQGKNKLAVKAALSLLKTGK